MRARLTHLWKTQRLMLMAFVLAIAVLGTFAARSITAAVYWMDPANQDAAIAPWMTPRYIAMSYKLPPEVIMPALMMDPDGPRKRITVQNIAADNDMSLQDLQSRVDAAATAFRAARDGQR